MSDLETKPQEYECGASAAGPAELLITARRVYLGKTTEVARALPDRDLRMIGAWCFLDHYGPEDIGGKPGMQVWAHPHTGLQTVSWLLEGEIEHRDSVGSVAMVRPGELNIMTAGHGIVHTEISQPDKPDWLHGVQLWLALPDETRDTTPRFDAYAELPTFAAPGVSGRVLIGSVAGVTSPAHQFWPTDGADLVLDAGAAIELDLDPEHEYGVFVVSGSATVLQTGVVVDQLLYLGDGRESVSISSPAGARLLLLGGRPFPSDLVMWWNFVGRSHDEIVAYREAWLARSDQFPAVVSRDERVMEAPPMPTIQLKPRPRRRGV